MIQALLRLSLRYRLGVLGLAIVLMSYGGWVMLHLPVDVFPDLNRPMVTVMTESGGLAPEEVELLVSRPIEAEMNGLPGVIRVRSSAGIGLSIVYIEFDWGTDIYLARQMVAEKLQLAASRMPQGLNPVMTPVTSIMGQIFLIGLRSDTLSPMALRDIADWRLRPRLMTVPGVAEVISIGGEVRQLHIKPDAQSLQNARIDINSLTSILEQASRNTSGGFLNHQGQEILVRPQGRLNSPEAWQELVVAKRKGKPILLKQLAEVSYGPAIKRGDASVNASPAVILSLQKQPGIDTLALTRQLEQVLEAQKDSLPEDLSLEILFRQATFIEHAIGNVKEALRDGAILVAVILMLFLWNGRTTLITLLAIPMSFVVSALVFKGLGISINTMTLGGLAVAVGELVDDAIVDIENIYRRLRENRQLPSPRPPLQVIYAASTEIRASIVYATLIVVLVFLPLFALSGIEGRLFAPLGLAYIVSLLASLMISLSLTPVLAYYLLPQTPLLERADTRLVTGLKRLNTYLLNQLLHAHRPALLGMLLVILAAFCLIPGLGREFLPPFNEGTATVNLFTMPGTSLPASNQLATLAEKQLLAVPEVVSIGRRTGRAEMDEHAEGVHYSELDVDFRASERSREAILQDMRTALKKVPGMVSSIGQPISHRLDHLLSGVRAQIAVKIFGPDLAVLRTEAENVRQLIAEVEGVVDLQAEAQVLVPQLSVRIRPEALQRYGLQPGVVAEMLETALQGKVLGQSIEDQKVIALVLRLAHDLTQHPQQLNELYLSTPEGARVKLADLAELSWEQGPNLIQREGGQRRMVVFSNTAGRDLNAVVAEIEDTLSKNLSLPEGYFYTLEGQFQSQQQASQRLLTLSIFSLLAILGLLYLQFGSLVLALQIMLTIPMSMVGGLIAVALSGGVLSVASLVGFVALTGIAARNSIMKISHYLHLLREEGEDFTPAMIIRASNERLVPVLMTALATGLALIPLAFSFGAPGKEILQPLALVILGGLLSVTLLDTLFTPVVFYHYARTAVMRLLTQEKNNTIILEDSET